MYAQIGCSMTAMTKKEISEKSRKAFEKARRGEFRSRPITPEKRVEYMERLARIRAEHQAPLRQYA